ncbi:MAG: hypothetical protein LE169_02350 [Endomicrobium sp.]|nr:hypothetical protein [Endomicrobium sp.]
MNLYLEDVEKVVSQKIPNYKKVELVSMSNKHGLKNVATFSMSDSKFYLF